MPQSKFSVTWSKLGDQYGPLTYLSIPGRNVLVVNSLKAAKELLENRALIYIDRSSFTMAIGLLGTHHVADPRSILPLPLGRGGRTGQLPCTQPR